MSEAEVVIDDLDTMSIATNYQRWLFEQVQPHLGSHVLEIGAGIGNHTESLLPAKRLVCLEPLPEAVAHLCERFQNHAHVRIVQGGITDANVLDTLPHDFDSAVCINVLEHVEDDFLAARYVHSLLAPGGNFILIVPAMPCLYGTIDRSVGHCRRYSKKRIRTVLTQAGFKIERLRWMNMPGAFGWFLTNRILRQPGQTRTQVGFYDRIVVPFARRLEMLIPPPVGLSLVVIAQKAACPV